MLFSVVFIFMCYKVVKISIESNLFQLMANWPQDNILKPWFNATLWDFYSNVLAIYVWICYKETSVFSKILWLLLLISLGSIGTMLYLLIQLFKLKEGEGLKELFAKRNLV
jgi:hypothetical protein